LRYQNIKFIEPENFENLRNLEELDLIGNNIEYLVENVFWALPNLKELYLNSNWEPITQLIKNPIK
jgi:Leucine-rich repeat (LRR) protein